MSAPNEPALPCFPCVCAVIYSGEAIAGKCRSNNGCKNCDHCPLGFRCDPVPLCLVYYVKTMLKIQWHKEAFEAVKETLRSSVEAWNEEVYKGHGPMHDTNTLIECCQATMGEGAIDCIFSEPLVLNAALDAMAIARKEGSKLGKLRQLKFDLE